MRRGTGRALLAAAKSETRMRGAKTMLLQVGAFNGAVFRFMKPQARV